MVKILFVCHGNICRSTMAEFIFKKTVEDMGIADKFYVKSAATSDEEIGNPVHPGTRLILNARGINCSGKTAVKIKKSDYDEYDLIIGMDSYNRKNMLRAFDGDPQNKISLLLDYTDSPRDVADPWYTGDFSATEKDVVVGCAALLKCLGY